MAAAADPPALFPGFRAQWLAGADGPGGAPIFTRTGGSGPPLLLLHGHPQTGALWHRVAGALVREFTLVITDLRGYGRSGKPSGDAHHVNYSRRTMALDQLAVMRALGFERFAVLAHDRGARVAHRLALDHANHVQRLVLLDIAPTLAMYERTGEAFARAYWHWFFLIQPAPLPERLIEADPCAYVNDVMGRRAGGLDAFDTRALAEYMAGVSSPGGATGICEDYRAGASIDLEHDRADRDAGRRLEQPLLVLWGEQGVVARCFDPLALWQRVALDVRGQALPCGHYIAEEAPLELLEHALPFLRGHG